MLGAFNQWPVQLQAAVIGAAVTLVGILVRDIVLKWLERHRESKRNALRVFRRYADPLASAASSLLWRFNEIFHHRGRASYLVSAVTEFEQYKRLSTLYRLAALLGWIRAFRRELSFLEVSNKRRLATLKSSIRSLESALADGPHIELQRLRGLAELWDLELPPEAGKTLVLGIALDNLIKPELHKAGVRKASDLPTSVCANLCERCARLLCRELGVQSLPSAVIAETRARAIQRITITEAWLYRDWQAAIGDLMICKSDHTGRAFEVIGYMQFERFWNESADGNDIWRERLDGLVADLDVSADERFDARILQMRQTMVATAKMVLALAENLPKHGVLLENTLKLAREIVSTTAQREAVS